MPVVGVDASGNPFEGRTPNETTENITAAGTVIANAATISPSKGLHVLSGAANAGVILPAAAGGAPVHEFFNTLTASNGIKIYPPVNGTINGGTANAAVNIQGNTLARFVATNGTNWAAMYTANS